MIFVLLFRFYFVCFLPILAGVYHVRFIKRRLFITRFVSWLWYWQCMHNRDINLDMDLDLKMENACTPEILFQAI